MWFRGCPQPIFPEENLPQTFVGHARLKTTSTKFPETSTNFKNPAKKQKKNNENNVFAEQQTMGFRDSMRFAE